MFGLAWKRALRNSILEKYNMILGGGEIPIRAPILRRFIIVHGGANPHTIRSLLPEWKKGGILDFLFFLYFMYLVYFRDHIYEYMRHFSSIWVVIGAKNVGQKLPFFQFWPFFEVFWPKFGKKWYVFKFVRFVIWHVTSIWIKKKERNNSRAHKFEDNPIFNEFHSKNLKKGPKLAHSELFCWFWRGGGGKRKWEISEWAEGELRGKIVNKIQSEFLKSCCFALNCISMFVYSEGGVKPITCDTVLKLFPWMKSVKCLVWHERGLWATCLHTLSEFLFLWVHMGAPQWA